jgi:hypothetical protein
MFIPLFVWSFGGKARHTFVLQTKFNNITQKYLCTDRDLNRGVGLRAYYTAQLLG